MPFWFGETCAFSRFKTKYNSSVYVSELYNNLMKKALSYLETDLMLTDADT